MTSVAYGTPATPAVATRGPIARIVHGKRAYILRADTEGLRVEDSTAAYVVPVSEFRRPVRVVPGRFWSALEIETARGKSRLSGFRAPEASSVAAVLNTTLQARARDRVNSTAIQIEWAEALISELLDARKYKRQVQAARAVAAAHKAVESSSHAWWSAWADDQQKMSVDGLRTFCRDWKGILAEANDRFVAAETERYSELFDSIENSPLTPAQRRACVINEGRNLVLAGAGTGKTSTMVGRAGYLITSGHAEPSQILMLAYARKAASEMQERQDTRLAHLCPDGVTPTIKTFHALGLEIIGKAEGRVPAISILAEDQLELTRFIDSELTRLCVDGDFAASVFRWCFGHRFSYSNPFDFDSEVEYLDYVMSTELRTMQGELVKSHEELIIANWLYSNGVQYRYEQPYLAADTADSAHRAYLPDFYLPEHDLYLEHFALDGSLQAPPGWDEYLAGVDWKRKLHQDKGSRLIETRSHMRSDGVLEECLEAMLRAEGVAFSPRPADGLLDELKAKGELKHVTEPVADFLGLLRGSGQDLHAVRMKASVHAEADRFELFFELFEPVLTAYEQRLAQDSAIDFGDMIARAIEHAETGRYVSPFTHILIDEFQDISPIRARLIKALLGQRSDAVLFAVGDDWQAIYRFTGSDLRFTRDFEAQFGASATAVLDKTFRFDDQLGATSSKFVQQNAQQLRKTIDSVRSADEPAVSLVPVADRDRALSMCLRAIEQRAAALSDGRASVLVLGRYNYVLDDWIGAARRRLAAQHPSLDIEFMTVHAAKGKEADYVVVLGLEAGKHGFPSTKRPEPIMELLLPTPEPFDHAEERRLFYVALTRARRRVYLAFEPAKPSAFVRELADSAGAYAVCLDELQSEAAAAPYLDETPCPECGHGRLVTRRGAGGGFSGCSRYPSCEHTEPACPKCGSPMKRSTPGKRICASRECGEEQPLCPKCGSAMAMRRGKFGRFWGCTKYNPQSEASCDGKMKLESIQSGPRTRS